MDKAEKMLSFEACYNASWRMVSLKRIGKSSLMVPPYLSPRVLKAAKKMASAGKSCLPACIPK